MKQAKKRDAGLAKVWTLFAGESKVANSDLNAKAAVFYLLVTIKSSGRAIDLFGSINGS
jgi:hypothetical protein